MSNKAAPHRKFVQTFVLAEQPNGYFVLNDIFRYIDEEEEEIGADDILEPGQPVAEAVPDPTPQTEPKTLPSSDDPVAQERVAQEVDKKLEQEVLEKQAPKEEAPSNDPPANGTAAENTAQADATEDAPAAAAAVDTPESAATPEVAEAAVEADNVQPEKPKDPDPTPVASPPQPTKAAPVQPSAPEAPSKPAAPKTWANLVAGPRVAAPAVPSPASSTSPAPSQPRAPAPRSQTQSPPTSAQTPAQAPTVETPAGQPQQGPGNGWQTAGQEHAKRQARPQSISGAGEGGNVLGYVKNVTDKVDASILKTTLQQYGKLAYFDVSRQKVNFVILVYYSTSDADSHLELRFRRVRGCSRLQCCRGGQPSPDRRGTNLRRRAPSSIQRIRWRLQRWPRWDERRPGRSRGPTAKPRPRRLPEGRRPWRLRPTRSRRQHRAPRSGSSPASIGLLTHSGRLNQHEAAISAAASIDNASGFGLRHPSEHFMSFTFS